MSADRRAPGSRLIGTRPSITVIIPVIDEAEALAGLLADLRAQRQVRLQIVVADGGSTDASTVHARQAGAEVIASSAGRGVQMNAGAAVATGDWLCFIHADSRLTHPDQLSAAIRTLADAGKTRTAGHFALRFVRRQNDNRFFYRYMQAKTATGRRYTINGDQGLVIHRQFFDVLGGFDTRMAFLEDQRMAAAVERQGRWRLLDYPLATSARRFEREGEGARYLLMALIMAMHVADVPLFFEQAPRVYARQAHTERLDLMPYFRLLRALIRRCGWRAALPVCWRIAGVTLNQSWQLFFAADIALARWLGVRQQAFTALHDRWLRPLLVHPPGQALLVLILLFLVFGPLQLWFALRENFRLGK